MKFLKDNIRKLLMHIIDYLWEVVDDVPLPKKSNRFQFFSNKNVMVIVPHQDDEINLLGGVLEQYIACGSDVSVVFATNGDYLGIAETRISEALKVLSDIGIESQNIFFFGFGDGYNKKYPENKEDIYNSENADDVWISHAGYNKTYGIKIKSCYKDLPYTRNNFLSCFIDIICEKTPDVIFCSDYDNVPTHRCVSLLFDEAMGIILKRLPEYRPKVFKGFCYSTSWTSSDDFYSSLNIKSTKNPSNTNLIIPGHFYTWDTRVRIPVNPNGLSRRLEKCKTYKSLYAYRSQYAFKKATRVIKGDRVFWNRRTDNLLLNAHILYNGKEVPELNDFKLVETDDVVNPTLTKRGTVALNGAIIVIFDKPVNINNLLLYQTNIESSKIISGKIIINRRYELRFSEHNLNQSIINIPINSKSIDELSIIILEHEGNIPRISQIEAYDSIPNEIDYIYPTDNYGNFVYDYWSSGKVSKFKLYHYTKDVSVNYSDIHITVKKGNKYIKTEVNKDGSFIVKCPKGKCCIVNIQYKNERVTFTVSNPFFFKRLLCKILSKFCNSSFLYNKRLAFAGYDFGNYESLIRGSQKYE